MTPRLDTGTVQPADAAPEPSLAAVASPGQTVFLRMNRPMSPEQIQRTRDTIDAAWSIGGVRIVLLDQGLEVARIEDAS